ncbi:MAG TPA: alpha-amylase family glycosyl hydrolase, partial [Thermoanaerobaculia bacterium]|nr:alpha-amylase family glycosyl hydrolase [Thermoanaerobaculia bacterium]
MKPMNQLARSRSLRSQILALLALSPLLVACAGGASPAVPPAPAAPAEAPVASEMATAAAKPGITPPRRPPGGWNHDWVRGAVFYEVFVRSFQDSNGDGIGDFRGLTARLDYLNDGDPATDTDLGVDALWLMPVFESPSYHGYDVVDYEAIERDYGTSEDFTRFLEEAHRRGIRVIVDFVMNHSSAQNPWFLESASSPASPRRDWYVWRADDPGWTQPWGGSNRTWHQRNGAFYYGVFWGGMPDLNFGTPAVREEMKRLAVHWLDRGLDGFRLDATRHLFADGPGDRQSDLPETHAFLKEFAAHVRRAHPDAVLVGENWTDTPTIAQYYGSTTQVPGGDELPMNFNFPLADAIVKGVISGDASDIGAKLDEIAELYPPGVIDTPFLTNHDMIRLATQLDDRPARLKSAASVLLTLPGAPFLYYGEEVGLQNGSADRADELKRTPMPWDATEGGGFTTGRPWYAFAPGKATDNVAAQTQDPYSLLSHYRRLIRARKSSPALMKGSLTLLSPLNRPTAVLAFLRETQG